MQIVHNGAKKQANNGTNVINLKMEKLARKLTQSTKGGLASAFITQGYYDADAFAIIVNSPKYVKQEGYVVYDEDQQKAVFIPDNEE